MVKQKRWHMKKENLSNLNRIMKQNFGCMTSNMQYTAVFKSSLTRLQPI